MNPVRCNRLVHMLSAAALLIATMPVWAGGGGGGAGGHGGGGGGGHGGGGFGGGGYGGRGYGGGGYGGGGYGGRGFGYGGFGYGGYGLGGYGWGGYGYGLGGYGWGYPAYGYGYGPGLDYGYVPAPIYAPGNYYSYPGFTNYSYNYPGLTSTDAATNDGLAHLNVKVPTQDAEVWFNGQRMTQTGTDRRFKSPPIAPGENYSYQVKARWMENGKPVERTQTVVIQANQQVNVDMANLPAAPPQVARFTVTVPTANTDVWLNGQRTSQTGTDRHFQSPPLTPGQNYSYEVTARWLENGKPMERKETVMFQAGKEVNVDLTKPVLTASK